MCYVSFLDKPSMDSKPNTIWSWIHGGIVCRLASKVKLTQKAILPDLWVERHYEEEGSW